MLPGGHEDAELHRLTQEGALPQRSMVHREEKPGLPLCRKVCYAIGGIPYQMTGNAIGFFLQIFLLDVVQMEPLHASLIIFLGRAWDAVTDPAIGFLVSKSPRRKYGKLVPWIACSMPFGVLCYCMMWSTLSDATPASLKFLWYLFMYSFFQTCMTCHHVPYSSLTMFLGGTQRDRDSATAYRMGMEVFSTLLGSGIQGQIVGRYHTRTMNSCYVSNETLSNTSTYSLTDSLENTRRAYIFASLVLGSIYCLSCLILIFGVREQPDHTGDLCLLLYSCRGAGWEVPALSTYYVGHSFPVYSLLAVVFGEIWKENSSVTGSGADHPSPGGRHPGDAQLPGLHLPGDHGRLQHGCALPFTMVSRGTSEPLVRWRGGEGYRESTTHDVPRLPICSIQQLLGCRGTCGIGTGKGCGCDTWSPSGIIQSVFGFSSKTPVTAQGAVFLLFF
ncbi:sodium-dependent lysophosphatidylcholine symporter 1-B-like isoform X4 [Rissa tridactyla]|uniref:sodium-dependent lysophosphatidylcholine symporter 1-B-like isoform X4 n=1 Tax=Rissa tridactyla TaxID=75485 RepID=UPI0023BA48BC|nr:sodium-dependent lysophosphatidylcholine symporter 1-B-like isoform X4 [Rissa tridactyla]